jgi:N-acetylneuraminic acid mutarotase
MNQRGAFRELYSGVILSGALFFMNLALASSEVTNLTWKQLPASPDAVGLAAPFAGVSGGALIVAGGANFPGKMPWEGGQKVWHDSVYVLPEPGAKWLSGFKLPRAVAYGVSITTSNGLICLGGADAHDHLRDVFLLRWRGKRIETWPLVPLPRPMAYGCGALVGNTIYLAGGTEHPDATNALKTFWSLDLRATDPQWHELDSWPGPARMLAVAGTCDSDFLLFSGVSLDSGQGGKLVRNYLQDAYRFTPGMGWRRIADLPRAAAAAPSPAILNEGELLIVSGDDGKLVNFEPKSAHPGFPRDVLAYDPRADKWTRLNNSPLSRATVPVVSWRGMAVIPNGEARPGYRTPEVWALETR